MKAGVFMFSCKDFKKFMSLSQCQSIGSMQRVECKYFEMKLHVSAVFITFNGNTVLFAES